LTQLEDLLEKIHARTATVGIIGLGYVGLPLALLSEAAKPEALPILQLGPP